MRARHLSINQISGVWSSIVRLSEVKVDRYVEWKWDSFSAIKKIAILFHLDGERSWFFFQIQIFNHWRIQKNMSDNSTNSITIESDPLPLQKNSILKKVIIWKVLISSQNNRWMMITQQYLKKKNVKKISLTYYSVFLSGSKWGVFSQYL